MPFTFEVDFFIEFVGGIVTIAVLHPPHEIHDRVVATDEWKLDYFALKSLAASKTKVLMSPRPDL